MCHIKPILRSLGYFMSEYDGPFTIQQLLDFLENIFAPRRLVQISYS